MRFFKRLSLRSKLMLVVVCIILAGFAITLSFLTYRASQVQQATALQYVSESADKYSRQAAVPLEKALNAADNLASALVAMKKTGTPNRELGNTLLRDILEKNPGFLSVWTVWEPNAFDNRDAEFTHTTGYDESGRYVPALIRGANGDITIAPVANYDKPGIGDYYQLPKTSGQKTMLEPFKYKLGDKEILQTAIAVPIVVSGKFLGVAGIGVSLANLQEMIKGIAVYETGYASLLSNKSIYVGDQNTGNLGKALSNEMGFPTTMVNGLHDAILKGERYQGIFNDARLDNAEATIIQVPVTIQGITTPWSLSAVVPTSKIQEQIRTLRWFAIGLGILSIAITCIVLSVSVNLLVLRPIGGEPSEAMALTERVAKGDLSRTIFVRKGDTFSLMYQLKHMQDSLARVVSTVRDGAQSVATASNQIATGNQDLSSRTESQASSLEETAASMEELSTTVHQNADHANQASALAQEASTIAEQGGAAVAQVVHTMQDINQSSHKINDITSVIDGIAFQTNILALNAAVEAARAGEQGRGFAVVASEVRSLAQRSAEAAKEIKTLISTSVEQIQAGSQQVDNAGATMQKVVDSIKQVSTIVQEISIATREQSTGISQVGEAVSQMDQVTQQNAALVEEMSAATASLRQDADSLVKTVSVFKVTELHQDMKPLTTDLTSIPIQNSTDKPKLRNLIS